MNKAVMWVAVAVAGAGAYFWLSQKPGGAAQTAEIVMPELSALAAPGEAVFNGTCAACHGTTLLGTDEGPPLLHAFYKPGHHGDRAIVNAVQNGSPQHHWQFGNMPAQVDITDAQIVQVIAYIREVQQANGFE